MCPSCGLYQVVFPGLLLRARFFDRNRANLGQIERLRLGWSLEEAFGLALGFAAGCKSQLGSVQACFTQAAQQGGSPAILLRDVIQSLPKDLFLPLIPCQLA